MRFAFILTLFLFCFTPVCLVHAAEPCKDCGAVSGKITVWKTRVRTQGARNDRDVIVFLERTGSTNFPAVTGQTMHMDQKNLIFIPHVLPVIKGSTVKFLNSDTVDHNVFLLFEKTGESLDLGTWGQGKTTEYLFNEAGVTIVLCKLHLEMAAYVVTMENPFFSQAGIDESAQSAEYSIANVPPGSYVLHAWHKKLKMKEGPVHVTVEKDHVTQVDITITKAKYAQ